MQATCSGKLHLLRAAALPPALAVCLAVGACSDDATEPDATVTAPDAAPAVDASDEASSDATADADAATSADAEAGPRPIRLPEDEQPHADPVEWWYYTGVLDTDSGQRYGFEMVTFQAAMAGARMYIMHFAVTDLIQQAFSHATRFSGNLQSQPAEGGYAFEIDGWQMGGHQGKDRLAAAMTSDDTGGSSYAIDLSLEATNPVVIQYGKGWMTIGSDDPFYYYSYTDMAVTGSLAVDGQSQQVSGHVWMDHQWGNMGGDHDGWRWFSLRMDDGAEVMIFFVDRADPFAGGTFIEADGSQTELTASDFTVTSTGQWTSPHTGATYPHGWTVAIPSRSIDVTLTPLLADQEFHKVTFEPAYWEGLCDLAGTRDDQPLTGQAYVELTGFAPSSHGL